MKYDEWVRGQEQLEARIKQADDAEDWATAERLGAELMELLRQVPDEAREEQQQATRNLHRAIGHGIVIGLARIALFVDAGFALGWWAATP